MRTEDAEPPTGTEFERIIRESRSVVMASAGARPTRRRTVRIAAFAIGAVVIFGGGVSLGSAVAGTPRVSTVPITHTIKTACYETPSSPTAFGYLSVEVIDASQHAVPSGDCQAVWEETAEQGSARASLLYVEQQYQQGLCESGGALNCAPITTPTPSGATVPPNWADCAKRAGYYVEVGYSVGGAAAACDAQGLKTR